MRFAVFGKFTTACTRFPVAWEIAFAMAAPVPVIPISPMPPTPSESSCGSGISMAETLHLPDISVHRKVLVRKVGVHDLAISRVDLCVFE
jgi:hypothetical protein